MLSAELMINVIKLRLSVHSNYFDFVLLFFKIKII